MKVTEKHGRKYTCIIVMKQSCMFICVVSAPVALHITLPLLKIQGSIYPPWSHDVHHTGTYRNIFTSSFNESILLFTIVFLKSNLSAVAKWKHLNQNHLNSQLTFETLWWYDNTMVTISSFLETNRPLEYLWW